MRELVHVGKERRGGENSEIISVSAVYLAGCAEAYQHGTGREGPAAASDGHHGWRRALRADASQGRPLRQQ